jgi:hypothetical protein
MAKGSKSAVKARSAVTGTYVKPGFAKAHPTTTVIERAKPAARPAAKAAARPAAKSNKSKAAAKKK